MPEILRAARIAPMSGGRAGIPPLITDGGLAVQDGRILAAGGFAEVRRRFSGPVRDLGGVTLAPAVFNCHTHLEMAHLRGRTVRGQGFVPWMRSLVSQPLYAPEPAFIGSELSRLMRGGCCFLADVSTHNAPQMAGLLAASGLFFVSFQEAIGRGPLSDPAGLLHPEATRAAVAECGRGVCSVSGHALYSTSPERLCAAKRLCRGAGLPFSLHLAENTDEDEMLLTGENGFLDLMRSRGLLPEAPPAPGLRPVPLAASLGLLDERTLCVHCVTVDEGDIALIAEKGAAVCLCPRSNAYIGEGRPPLMKFLAAGVNVCLGTDGLCSNDDLDPYGELRFLGGGGAPLSLTAALALVTVNPARFFGLSDRLGRLAPGCEARFSIVPDDVLQLFEQR